MKVSIAVEIGIACSRGVSEGRCARRRLGQFEEPVAPTGEIDLVEDLRPARDIDDEQRCSIGPARLASDERIRTTVSV
jgi:hypothetical protein